MKTKACKIFVSTLLVLSLAMGLVPLPVWAETATATTTTATTTTAAKLSPLAELMAGVKTVEEVFGLLDPDTVPEIVGYDNAVAKTHISRLYDAEGQQLNKVVFLNADGTQTAYLYDYPVKYVDTDGKIKDITLNIGSASKGGAFAGQAAWAVTTFSHRADDGIVLTGNGENIKLVPHIPAAKSTAGLASSAGTVSKATEEALKPATAQKLNDKTVAYRYDAKTSLEYSLTYTGFKEDIVVSEYTGQTEYTFTLFTNGLALVEREGSFYLVDQDQTVKATLGDIIIFTADEANNGRGSMSAQTVAENQQYLLTVRVDADYLADEKTVYPIRIDPTVEICYDNNGAGAIADVTLNSNAGSGGSSGSLFVGLRENYGISRILMKFPGLDFDSLGNNIIVTSASVELRDLICESVALEVSCYVFSGNEWDEATAGWSTVDPNSTAAFLSSQSVSYANGVQKSSAHRYSFDITDAVEGWRTNSYNQNKGIIFMASSAVENGSVYNAKTFASYNRASNKPSLSVTYQPTSNFFDNGTYYLNNRYCGDYLQYASGAATASSGLIASLGHSIQWEMVGVNGGYVIRFKIDPTKYLGVPSATSSAVVSIVTVEDTDIPAQCIWNIQIANGGGCLVQNAYNARYLCSYGDAVYTDSSTGAVGTVAYDAHVWRIISTSNYGNSSLYLQRELPSGCKFKTLHLFAGDSKEPTLQDEYNNVLWRTADNFNFTGYDASRITVDPITGKFTATSSTSFYSTTIVATHKVTERTTTFVLVINPKAALVGVSNADHDHSSALYNIQPNLAACGYSGSIVYTGAFSVANIDSYLDTDTNSLFVSRSHAGPVTAGGTQVGTALVLDDLENTTAIYTSYGSISTLDLTNMQLVMFIGCESAAGGEGGLNLPSVAVAQGATTAVGFTESIGCSTANNWTREFFDLIESGVPVLNACTQLAQSAQYSSTTMTDFVVCGYKYTRFT